MRGDNGESLVLAVFNAPENYEFYKSRQSVGGKIVNVACYKGADFPCTVGVVLPAEEAAARSFLRACIQDVGEDGIVFLKGLPDSFLDYDQESMIELCVSVETVLSNPFDPALVSHNAIVEDDEDPEARKYPCLYRIRERRIARVGRVVFTFDLLRSFGQDRERPHLKRAIELSGRNAMCEIFEKGLSNFDGVPVGLRRSSGMIDSSRYPSYGAFASEVGEVVDESVLRFVASSRGGFLYDNVLRIARGMCLAHEAGVVGYALGRLSEVLCVHQLDATQQARQFEIDVIRVVSE